MSEKKRVELTPLMEGGELKIEVRNVNLSKKEAGEKVYLIEDGILRLDFRGVTQKELLHLAGLAFYRQYSMKLHAGAGLPTPEPGKSISLSVKSLLKTILVGDQIQKLEQRVRRNDAKIALIKQQIASTERVLSLGNVDELPLAEQQPLLALKDRLLTDLQAMQDKMTETQRALEDALLKSETSQGEAVISTSSKGSKK